MNCELKIKCTRSFAKKNSISVFYKKYAKSNKIQFNKIKEQFKIQN